MSRLPTVGADANSWGAVLNDYLSKTADAGALASSPSAGATTFDLAVVPPGLQAGSVIAIDGYTTECELRLVQNIGGSTITVTTPITFAHASGDAVLVITGSVSSSVWACKADGSTDDHAALQRAIIECQAQNVVLEGGNKTHMISQPLLGREPYIRRMVIKAKAGYAPASSANAMFMVAQEVPQTFTVAASTDTFTTPAAHGIGGAGNPVVFQGTSLPAPLVSGTVYYIKTVPTSTTFTISATSGGATLDITADGSGTVWGDVDGTGRCFFDDVYFNGSSIANVNGIDAVVQQPTLWNKVRVDDCPGYGVKIRGQDGMFYNLQIGRCGTGLVLGGVAGEVNAVCTIMKFYALDVEQCTTQGVLFNNATGILIDGFHGESQPIQFNLPSSGAMLNVTFSQIHVTYTTGTDIGWKINSGAVGNSSFQIIGHRAYGSASGQKIINDLDRSRDVVQADLDQGLTLGVFVQPAGNVLSHTVEKVPAFVSVRSGALSFGSIAANTSATQTVTVTGATAAMAAFVSPEGNPGAGLVWSARVSAADTVTIILANVTTGSVASTDWNWRVVCGAAG